jgi:GNAT superfamily N-acetyltransferase
MRRERDDGYVVTTDRERLDLDLIHGFLRTAYWSTGIPRETVARALEHSIPFGLYGPDGAQCGFARVVSDRATFAYLGDVFVLPKHRGRGLGVWLVECVLGHPELQGLRKWHLATADAHELYERFGFRPPSSPEAQLFVERRPAELWGMDPI